MSDFDKEYFTDDPAWTQQVNKVSDKLNRFINFLQELETIAVDAGTQKRIKNFLIKENEWNMISKK